MDAKVSRRAVLGGAIGGGLLAALPATPVGARSAECPGNALYARLPALRRAVAVRLDALTGPHRHVNPG
jgi:hypothetical protein